MKISACLVAFSTLATAVPATAGPEDVARAAGCLVCHSAEKKMLGPTWRDIAARYRGDPAAPALVAERIRIGSKGAWGDLPMPSVPAERMSDAELAAVVAWLLAH